MIADGRTAVIQMFRHVPRVIVQQEQNMHVVYGNTAVTQLSQQLS